MSAKVIEQIEKDDLECMLFMQSVKLLIVKEVMQSAINMIKKGDSGQAKYMLMSLHAKM